MGFVEAVLGKLGHLVKDRLGLLDVQPLCLGPFQERFLFLGHNRRVFFTHGAAQQVGPSQGVTGQGAGDLHDLFLVNNDPVGVLQDRLQLGQVVDHLLAAMLALDEFIHHAAAQRAGTIEGAGSDHVFKAGGLQLDQHLLHAAGFKLEDAGGVAGGDQIVAGLVIIPQPGDIKFRVLPFPDHPHRVLDHGQVL